MSQKSLSEYEVRVLGAFRNSFAYAGNTNYSFLTLGTKLEIFFAYLNNNRNNLLDHLIESWNDNRALA